MWNRHAHMSVAPAEAPPAPTQEAGTLDMTDLERLFEESVPCITHTDRPATWLLCHPVGCETPVCLECKQGTQAFINEIRDHLANCPAHHNHEMECLKCHQCFTIEDVLIRPMKG